MQTVRDWNPTDGVACQGDIVFIAIPSDVAVSVLDEIKPISGRLIIQEGEVSGHHHAIDLLERHRLDTATPRKTSRSVEQLLSAAQAGKIELPQARLYRDPRAVEALRRCGILTRTDLAVGCLVVTCGPMVVVHEEHDGIRLPVGRYYVGHQVESAGAEERVVSD